MGIEQRIEFNTALAEKLEAAHHFNIIASPENLAKLEKRDGAWEFNGISAETLLELYKAKDNSAPYNNN